MMTDTATPDQSDSNSGASLVRSRQRVSDHGEVFTPSWMVESMLDLVKEETERIDSRFLEPACGSGNFLKAVLARKLAAVKQRHGRSEFERCHYALFAVMCTYGIELLGDNVQECRANLRSMFADFLKIDVDPHWYRAVTRVLEVNIVQGDALSMSTPTGDPITFPEWGYLGAGKYQRRDFRYEALARQSSTSESPATLFGSENVFTPANVYPVMTVQEIAQ